MLSYFDWNDYADLLADALAGRGIGQGDVIALTCRNRMEWAVVAIAASKLDAPLLSLSPDLSVPALRDRLIAGRASAFIAGDCDPAAIAPAISGLPLALRATMDAPHVAFYNFWDLFGPAAPPRFGRAQPSQIAWTQGTRGQPQAVAIPPRRTAPASISRPPMPEHGCSLVTVPPHRIWHATQFWAALSAGRAIALVRHFNPFEVLQVIERRGVTHWSGLPEHFQRLSTLPAHLFGGAARGTLKEVVVGGAACSPPLKAWIMATFGPIVGEAYGSTETGLIALMPADRQGDRPDSCGRPTRGVIIEIRDAQGSRLPPNAIGEIWARTPRSLEADFISSRGLVSRRDEAGFVATGDSGRLDEDGYLYLAR